MEIRDELSNIKLIINDKHPAPLHLPDNYQEKTAQEVRRFHTTIKGYKATPLVALTALSGELGVSGIYVKDESYRFGLNSFKGLGATYAIAQLLNEILHIRTKEVHFELFKKDEIRKKIKDMVLVTATDGNHGKGVAWAATQLGCKSIVYLPKGAASQRVNAIKQAGADTFVTEYNYDDTVRYAAKMAKEKGWYLVQDTGFEGYEKIPNWISQGYMTMVVEALDQLKLEGVERPTHVFLQAGVGAMAGGILGYLVNRYHGKHPSTIIMEPEKAACIYKSAYIGDGKPHNVLGELDTIMAGLSCGEPNKITWEILRDYSTAYVSCPDFVSANGVRILGNPLGNDKKVVSGESGSVGIGLLHLLMTKNNLAEMRKALGLGKDSILLFFNTEGDTDPENYRKILHEGKYPSII